MGSKKARPKATKRYREAMADLTRTAKSLATHAATLQKTKDPTTLRKTATYVRNCALWIEWSADKLTTEATDE